MEFINNNPNSSWLANKKGRVVALVLFLLAAGNAYFGTQYVLLAQENKQLHQEVEAKQGKEQAVVFLNLFIEKVLKTDKEVSFEDRLKLENAIRDINDPELLAKWEKFTSGTTEEQIQQGVKDLLEALGKKIS